jgi:HEAT repeat protein
MNAKLRSLSAALLFTVISSGVDPGRLIPTTEASTSPRGEVAEGAAVTRADLRAALSKLASRPSPEARSREWLSHLERWSRVSDRAATAELLWSIVEDASVSESDRYLCLQGAADLDAERILPRLEKLLRSHPSAAPSSAPWMLRSAAVQALARLRADSRSSVSTLLHVLKEDPALVVRLEAVHALAALRPAGVEAALLAAAEDARNWNGNKPIWIPAKAIETIEAIRGESANVPAGQLHPIRARIAYWKAKVAAP